ncbi:hypothetical protein MauCBS54593_003006 [Microsporum audouinii]
MDPEDETKTMKNNQVQVHESNISLEDGTRHPETVPDPAPNGGRNAWMQVIGAFVLTQNTWGLVMAHGAFQASYSMSILSSSSQSALSWIGSTQAFLILFVGLFSSRAANAGHFYHVAVIGILLQVLGLVITSFSTKYYQFLLAEGLCVGIGSGLLFAPGITIAASCFSTRRPLATAIAISGAAIGGIAFPIVSYWLIAAVGFPWAVRIITSLMFLTSGSTIYTLRVNPSSPEAQNKWQLLDFSSFKDPVHCTFVIGTTLGFIAGFIPFFYAPTYALGLGLRSELAGYFLSAMNTASLIGGFALSIIATRVGNLNTLIFFTNISGIIFISIILAQNAAGLIIASLIYAFVAGYQLLLVLTAVASISLDTSPMSSQARTALVLGSLGALIGTPIAGGILLWQNRNLSTKDITEWNFTLTLLSSWIVILICGAFMTATRVLKSGLRWEKI